MSDEKWPHADLAVQWYSAPKGTMEWRRKISGYPWDDEWQDSWAPPLHDDEEYELRPIRKMETIPEARVPAPLRVAPKYGADYFAIAPAFENGICRYQWIGNSVDRRLLGSGLAFATEQDARDFLTAITARREE